VAVNLDTYLYFDSGSGAAVAESGWRLSMKHMLGSGSGVIRGFGNDFQTIGDSSGMQVKVNTGECWMYGHYGQSTSQKTLPIASNSSGSTRIDIAVLRVHFGNNNIVTDIVQGTPGGSAPNVTQNTTMWETKLADITVASGAVTITAGNVSDRRVYTVPYAKYTRTTTQLLTTNTLTDITFNFNDFASGDVVPNSSTPTTFTLNRAGLWTIAAQAGWLVNSSNSRLIYITDSTGTPTFAQTECAPSADVETLLQCTAIERFSVGQTIKVRVRQNSGGNLSLSAGNQQVVFIWGGP
jgi:hypothetical protein